MQSVTKTAYSRRNYKSLLLQVHGFTTLVLYALFMANTAYAATTVTASVNPAAATVGDRLTYEIIVIADNETGAEVKPEPLLGDSAPFELLDAKAVTVNELTHKLIFSLAIFQTGRFQLPVYTLHWIDSQGNPQSVSTDPVFVEILSVLRPEQKEPENLDISPPADAVLDWRAYVLPAAITIALLAALLAIIWRLKKRPEQKINVTEQKYVSPAEAALMRLADLERKNLMQSGQAKKYFTELSDSFREYLEKEFSIDAMEKTTFELEAELPTLLEGHRERIISLLKMCDAVKFAKAELPPEEAPRAIADTRDLIVTTSKININSHVAGGMETEKLPV